MRETFEQLERSSKTGWKRRSLPSGASGHQEAESSLSALARNTGISDSSLSRFESDAASPSFDDVCLIAAATGWPLLFFATGRPRTDDDPRDLVSQLAFWGLRDMDAADSGLIGESRAFEPLVLQAVGQHRPTARIIEVIPGLLLHQRFPSWRGRS